MNYQKNKNAKIFDIIVYVLILIISSFVLLFLVFDSKTSIVAKLFVFAGLGFAYYGVILRIKHSYNEYKKLNNVVTKKEFINKCIEFINKYERESDLNNSTCKEDILKLLTSMNDVSVNENELDIKCNIALMNISAQLLSTGEYCIHYEQLNPISSANNLMNIYKCSSEYLIENNLINKEKYIENLNNLNNNIKNI